MFNLGDRVVWISQASGGRALIGTVVNVFRSDSGLHDFDLCDVFFETGLRTIHGVDLRPVTISAFPCEAREQLFKSYKIAVDVYAHLTSQLADLVSGAAHSEFEFFSRKVEAARTISNAAGERLKTHRAAHGC